MPRISPSRTIAWLLAGMLAVPAAFAQPKPAVVKDVGESERVPFGVTLPLRDFFNCTTLPAQCQAPVPAGKRFVVESLGAYLQIGKSGGPGRPRAGLYVDGLGARTYFPLAIVTSDASEDNWAVHTPFRGYLDPGQTVSCALNGASLTGSPSFSGDCVLTGYLIDKP